MLDIRRECTKLAGCELGHGSFQNKLYDLGRSNGYEVVKEYKIMFFCNDKVINGRIDVVWLKDDVPNHAFEIDKGIQVRSLEKLKAIGCTSWLISRMSNLYYIIKRRNCVDMRGINHIINPNANLNQFYWKKYNLK